MRYLTAANIGRLVAILAAVAVTHSCTRSCVETETQEKPEIEQKDRAANVGDLLDDAMPSRVTQYEAPDTTDTRTDCIRVPTWLLSTGKARSSTRSLDFSAPSMTGRRVERGGSTSMSAPNGPPANYSGMTPLPKPAYAIIPTTKGRPRVSVTRRQVSTSTIDPETGAMSTWTWDIERPDNRLAAIAEAGTLPGTAYALAGGQYTRHLGRLDVWGLTLDTQIHAGAGQAWTARGVGAAFRTGFSIGITW